MQREWPEQEHSIQLTSEEEEIRRREGELLLPGEAPSKKRVPAAKKKLPLAKKKPAAKKKK